MYNFYIVKYHPYFRQRNWFKIWNLSKTKFLKIIINPVDQKLIVYFCENYLTDIEIKTETSLNLYLYLYKNKTENTSILQLPLGNKIQLNGNFQVGEMEATNWLDIIAYHQKTREIINQTRVDSLTGKVLDINILTSPNYRSDSDSDSDNDTENKKDGGNIDDNDNTSTNGTNKNRDKDDEIDNIVSQDMRECDQLDSDSDSDSNSTVEIDNNIELDEIINTEYKNKKGRKDLGEFNNTLINETNNNERQFRLPTVLEKYNLNTFKKLSFCSTCLNRLSQIKKVLPINLKHNLPLKDSVEFVVIDFGTLGLYEWIYENFSWALRIGYLRYIRTDKLKYWHAPIAKNTSHNYAKGEILVNLDCDNFTGKLGGLHVLKIFEKYGKDIMFHQWSGVSKDGTYGRISCHRDNFYSLGGYDETFLPMGYQDHDLIMRFRMLWGSRNLISYKYLTRVKNKYLIFPKLYSRAVGNDKSKSMANTDYVGKMKWQRMNNINKNKSHRNLMSGILKVNRNIRNIGINIY